MSQPKTERELMKEAKKIRAYGDHWDDGKVQLSFTLPVAFGDKAKEAARMYLEKMGFDRGEIVSMEGMGQKFSFFVAYAYSQASVFIDQIVVHKPEFPIVPMDDLVEQVKREIKRKIVVVGGTLGTDAHTVGIDAILSIKGLAGDKGLEYYPFFKVVNLRAQVSAETFVSKAAELGADAVLVSQLVTQQDQHLKNLKELNNIIKSEKKIPSHLIKIVGGPRMDHKTAKSIGFDAGFGPGTKPSEVVNYIVHELSRRFSPHKTTTGPGPAPSSKKRGLLSWFGN